MDQRAVVYNLQEILKNLGALRTRRPAGSLANGRNSAEPPNRSAEFQRIRHLNWADGWYFVPRGSSVDCVESSGSHGKSRRFADPSPGRFFGEWAKISGRPARSAEIWRNRHLHGEAGRNFVRRESPADCSESAENADKSLLFADPTYGQGFGARFRAFPARSSEIQRNSR